MKKKIYNTGVYCRLSREDKVSDLSLSIMNQKKFIKEYSVRNGLKIVDYYCDDGYTGTDFNRPAFRKMLEDIEKGKINCVITKDLSRLGRNYVQTGYYIEDYFLERGIRYIAINDNLDTMVSENDLVPFKNIFNEWYAKDISRKVKSAFSVKRKKGEMVSGQPLYGYYYEKGSTRRLIAEYEAKIVKLIFEKYLIFKSVTKVAKYLEKQKISSPKYSLFLRYSWFDEFFKNNQSCMYHWNANMVRLILKNKEYLGITITNKTRRLSYKNHKIIKNNAEDYIECSSPRIISDELFNECNRLLNENKYKRNFDSIEKPTLLVLCPLCGKEEDFVKNIIRYKDKRESLVYYGYRCTRCQKPMSICKIEELKEIIFTKINMRKRNKSCIIEEKDMYGEIEFVKPYTKRKFMKGKTLSIIEKIEFKYRNIDSKIEVYVND